MAQNPKPKTVAIVAADAEFSKNASDGARENAKKFGLKIVYDKSYPPSTTDFSPIVRAIQATNADLVVVCSYPLNSVGMVQAVNEAGLKPKMIGGAMVGLQSTVFKTKLGPKLNGFMNYESWVPAEIIDVPGTEAFFEEVSGARRQGRRRSARLLSRRLGLCLYRHAGQGGRGDQEPRTTTRSPTTCARHLQDHHGRHQVRPNGEWAKSRHDQVQYHGIKQGAGLETWKGMSYQTVLTPNELATGKVIYPYEKAAK